MIYFSPKKNQTKFKFKSIKKQAKNKLKKVSQIMKCVVYVGKNLKMKINLESYNANISTIKIVWMFGY